MTKIVAIGFDTVRKHPSLHRCFWAVRNDSLRDVEVLLDRSVCMIVCEVHHLKCFLSVFVGSSLNTWSSYFELFQCSVFGSCTCWFIIRDRSWAFVMVQCHFGRFDSFACLFFSLFVAYGAVISGVLRSWGGEIAPFRSIASARAAVYSQSSSPTESLGAG